jgi:cyclopropane fatty-acyl-phospholipid synthase-like methyltransferase
MVFFYRYSAIDDSKCSNDLFGLFIFVGEYMTVWDKIYQNYKQGGEKYATLREGLISEFLSFMQANDFKIKKVLDIGCGNGKYLVFLKNLGFMTDGIDSSPTTVAITKESLNDSSKILCVDMYEYNPPEAQYDLIISIAAIHHGLKKQIRDLIRRIHASLLPGGRFFITLPDNEGSAHWTMMVNHKEIEPGTRIPLSGPEKDLPHSAFTKEEIKEMFLEFSHVKMQLLAERGRWIVTGAKER